MIGDAWTASYPCGYEPSGTEATLIGWTGSLPGRRMALISAISCLPITQIVIQSFPINVR